MDASPWRRRISSTVASRRRFRSRAGSGKRSSCPSPCVNRPALMPINRTGRNPDRAQRSKSSKAARLRSSVRPVGALRLCGGWKRGAWMACLRGLSYAARDGGDAPLPFLPYMARSGGDLLLELWNEAARDNVSAFSRQRRGHTACTVRLDWAPTHASSPGSVQVASARAIIRFIITVAGLDETRLVPT